MLFRKRNQKSYYDADYMFTDEMMMENDSNKTRVRRFVAMRRKLFSLLLVLTFVILLMIVGKRYDSGVEIIGVSFAGAVLLTSLISVVSIPVIWIVSGRQKYSKL